MRTRSGIGAALSLVLCITTASAQQPRVHPDARQIRGHRLTTDHVRKLEQISEAMAKLPTRGPEAPRSDVALAVVLSQASAFNEPLTDGMIEQHVGLIDAGHSELAAAIRSAGLTTRDYVLSQIALLVTYPVVAQQRAGRLKSPPPDVSAENAAFIERHWTDVDRLMRALQKAIDSARKPVQ